MHRFLLLCATFATLLTATSSACADWGTLTGQFVLDGKAPTPSKVQVTKDQQVCGKFGLVDEKLVVNSDNNGIAGIVVWIYLKRGAKAPETAPGYAKNAESDVVVNNKDCRFDPHVVLLRTSQKLVVGNLDPVGHNTKIDAVKNVPVNPIIPAGGQETFSFPKEERLPTKVSCSIHPWMTSYVLIKDNPYMAVTDKDGRFAIKDLPTGKWTFQVWQEASGYVDAVDLDGKKTKWKRGRFDYTVKAGDNEMGVIKVKPSVFK